MDQSTTDHLQREIDRLAQVVSDQQMIIDYFKYKLVALTEEIRGAQLTAKTLPASKKFEGFLWNSGEHWKWSKQ